MKIRLAFGILIWLCIALAGCDLVCENEVLSATASPDGSKKAFVFVRGCGATTGDSTQVSIVSAWRGSPSGSGNALVVEGRPPLEVRWIGPSELALSKLGSGRIFKQENKANGVSVRYEYAL